MKKQEQIINPKVLNCKWGVVNCNFTNDEIRDFKKLKSIRLIKSSGLATYLFMQKFPEFIKNNKFGVYIPYAGKKEDIYVEKVQFRVDSKTSEELEQLCGRTGLPKTTVARMMIIPALQEELEKFKELI